MVIAVADSALGPSTPAWKQAGAIAFSVDANTELRFRFLNPNGFIYAIRALCLKSDAGTPSLTPTGQQGDQTATNEYYRDGRDFGDILGAYALGNGYGYDAQFSGWAASGGHGSTWAAATHITAADPAGTNIQTTKFNDTYLNSEGAAPANRITAFPSGTYNIWLLVGGGNNTVVPTHEVEIKELTELIADTLTFDDAASGDIFVIANEYYRDGRDFQNIQMALEPKTTYRYQAEPDRTAWEITNNPVFYEDARLIAVWGFVPGTSFFPTTNFGNTYLNDNGQRPPNGHTNFPARDYALWVFTIGGDGSQPWAHQITVGANPPVQVRAPATPNQGNWRLAGTFFVDSTTQITFQYMNPNDSVHGIKAICLKTFSDDIPATTEYLPTIGVQSLDHWLQGNSGDQVRVVHYEANADGVDLGEQWADERESYVSVVESMHLDEMPLYGNEFYSMVADGLGLTPNLVGTSNVFDLATESLVWAEAVTSVRHYLPVIADSLALTDTNNAKQRFLDVVADSAALADALTETVAVSMTALDSFAWTDAQANKVSFYNVISESVFVPDSPGIVNEMVDLLADSMAISDDPLFTNEQAVLVADSIDMAGAIVDGVWFLNIIADNIGENDVISVTSGAVYDSVIETLDMAEAATENLWVYFLDVDSMNLLDAANFGALFDDLLDESMDMADVDLVGVADVLVDTLTMTDTAFDGVSYTNIIDETTGWLDVTTTFDLFVDLVGESMDMADLSQSRLEGNDFLDETLALPDLSLDGLGYSDILQETIDLAEVLLSIWDFLLADTMIVTDVVQSLHNLNHSVIDAWAWSDTSQGTFQFQVFIDQALTVWDSQKIGWGLNIADTLNSIDTIDSQLAVLAAEILAFQELLVSRWKGTDTVADRLTLWDTSVLQKIFFNVLAESLSQGDDASAIHRKVMLVSEILRLAAVLEVFGFQSVTLTDGVKLDDRALAAWEKLVAESLAFPDSVVLQLVLQVFEGLLFGDQTPVIGRFGHALAEVMLLADIAGRAWEALLADSMDAADVSLVQWLAQLFVADSAALSDVSSDLFRIQVVNADAVGLADLPSVMAILYSILAERIDFEITIVLDGEVWQCWSLHTAAFLPSVYSGFEFNSFCSYQGQSYGAKSSGVYLLEGATDAGTTVYAGARFTQSNFGLLNTKRLQQAYFGMSGGVPVLKVITDQGTERYYAVSGQKTPIERDVYGVEWTLSLTDFNDLHFVELIPVILAR